MSALPRPRPERRQRLRPVALAAADSLATLAPIPFPSRRAEAGLVEWFRPGEYDRAEQALADLQALGVQHLRTGISWADCHTLAGTEWYQWLLPRLARQVEVLPCIVHASPPRPRDYADFVDEILTRFGRHFEYLDLWHQSTILCDEQWPAFHETIGRAARCAHRRGWKTVLGGLTPVDWDRLRMLFDHGLMEHIDVAGFRGFSDRGPRAWEEDLTKAQRLLDERRSKAEIWITETGVSTWREAELRQCQALVAALEATVSRVYWYSLHDLDRSLPAAADLHTDEGDYHFGLKRCDGTPKLLFRLWSSGGLRRVREAARQSALPAQPHRLIPFRKAASRGPGRIPQPSVPAGANAGPGAGAGP